jgi:lysophospholipase L1-like esterase
MFAGGTEKSRYLAAAMQSQAERHGAAFLDAGKVAHVSPMDGIHFDSDNHRAIGAAIAEKIRQQIS